MTFGYYLIINNEYHMFSLTNSIVLNIIKTTKT